MFPKRQENLPFKVADKIKIIGIHFEHDKMANEIENNWNSKLERLQSIIKDWRKRDLCIQGKVIVVKSFLVSQLVYVRCNRSAYRD